MDSVNSVYSNTAPPAITTTTPKRPSQQLGTDLFLQLLVTQLRYQDPMSGGQDTGEMMTQLTLFTLLEQVTKLQQAVEKQNVLQEHQRALGLLNQNVTVMGLGGTLVHGTVSAVDYRGAEPYITVNGLEHRLSALVRVEAKDPAQEANNPDVEGGG